MGDKKPSGMTLTTPAASDLLFFERPADTTARYSTVGALVQSQVASLTEKGAVELATTAEAQTGTDATRAVTPAGLAAYFDQTLLVGDNANWRFSFPNRPGDYYALAPHETTFDGVVDPVMYLGFNINNNGGRIDNSKPLIVHQFEYDYYAASVHTMEYSMNTIDTAGNPYRWLAFTMNRDDSAEAYWQFKISNGADASFFSVIDLSGDDLFVISPYVGTIEHNLRTSVIGNFNIVDVGSKNADTAMLYLSRTATPSSSYYGARINPIINMSANGSFGGMLVQPTYTTPNSTLVSALNSLTIQSPTINLGSGGSVAYAITCQVVAAPTEAIYGNWALWVSGNSGFENNVGFGGLGVADTLTDTVDIFTGTLRQRVAKTPANAGDTGRTGQICWDASYIYVCTGTNTWKRAAISTW